MEDHGKIFITHRCLCFCCCIEIITHHLNIWNHFCGYSIFPGIPTENPIDNDTCAWISMNSPMKRKYGSKLSIAAWVHSHVEGVECCFSSVDLHTQFTWSQVFPDILGLVFEIDQDGLPAEYDFYGLTTQGVTKLRECRKPGSDGHVECDKKSYYTSKLQLIDPIDIHLEVHDFFQMSYPNEQLFENEWPTIEESTKRKLKPVKPSAHEVEVEIQDQEDKTDPSDSYQSQDHEKECEGCKKTYNIDTFFKHFRRAKKCKEKYGDRYDDMIKERRKNYKNAHNFKNTQKRNEKAKQIYAENKEARKENFKQNYAENREARKQNYAENRDEKNEKAKQDHVKNKDRNNQRDKERRKIAKIESKEFEKRFQKFKKETKDGPSFACQCCHRTLFYRGIYFKI